MGFYTFGFNYFTSNVRKGKKKKTDYDEIGQLHGGMGFLCFWT